MIRTARIRSTGLGVLAGMFMIVSGPADARPVYAIKEGRPCAYCHVNPNGGGPRNPRGLYYAMNKHSFAGYDEVRVMGRTGSTVFKLAWRESLLGNVLKVAVAPTHPDGLNRLILLSESAAPSARRLEIRKWSGAAWVTDFEDQAPAGTDRLAAGKYATGLPAVIATSKAFWYWDSGKYVKKPTQRELPILGSVILRDGTERLLVREGEGLKMHAIDPKSPNLLLAAQDPPASAQTTFFEMKGRTEELKALEVPDLLAAGGVLGLWDTGKPQPLLYAIQIAAQLAGTGAKPDDLVIKGQDVYLSVIDPRSATIRALWRSEKLKGNVLDVALNDPHSAARGLTVLTAETEGQKGRSLYFFQLE